MVLLLNKSFSKLRLHIFSVESHLLVIIIPSDFVPLHRGVLLMIACESSSEFCNFAGVFIDSVKNRSLLRKDTPVMSFSTPDPQWRMSNFDWVSLILQISFRRRLRRTQSLVGKQTWNEAHIHSSRSFFTIVSGAGILTLLLLVLDPKNLPPILGALILRVCPRRAWSHGLSIVVGWSYSSDWAECGLTLPLYSQRLSFDPSRRETRWRRPLRGFRSLRRWPYSWDRCCL